MILFGAGASYGTDHAVPSAPPLGADLFPELQQHYPTLWGALSAELAETFAEDFEAGMLALAAADGHAVAPLMQAMTHYFAGFRLDGSGHDLYSRLLAELPPASRERTLFSTLNYECLFEIAAAGHRLRIHYDRQPLSSESIRIWKLHGSCNFIPQEIRMRREGVSYAFRGVTFNTPLQFIQPEEARLWVAGDNALYAAMCLYTVDKPTQIGAQFITDLQTAWGDAVLNAEQVIVVGTRPHDQDRHLWDPLAKTLADLHYVGSPKSFETWLKRSGRPTSRSHLIDERFEQAINRIVELLH